MKIENGQAPTAAQQEAMKQRIAAYLAAEPPQEHRAAGDAFKVDISPEASQNSLQKDSDEISHDRVAAIRDQLAAGTYNISGKDVARKILGVLK